MDVSEVLHKAAQGADLDFYARAYWCWCRPRSIAKTGAGHRRAQCGTDQPTASLLEPGVGYAGGHAWSAYPEGVGRQLLASLLEPRRRSERALLAIVQQAYVERASNPPREDLV